MTPQEHYEKAEKYAHDAWFQDAETAPMRAALAQAHATLALAGFTRDASMRQEDYSGWKPVTAEPITGKGLNTP
jgi:hypothetical protein